MGECGPASGPQAAVDQHQGGEQQTPADHQRPGAHRGPPPLKPTSLVSAAMIATSSQQRRADRRRPGGPGPGHLDPTGQAEGDGQHHRREHVDQPADGEADAQPRRRGVQDRLGARPGRAVPAARRTGPGRTRPGCRGRGSGWAARPAPELGGGKGCSAAGRRAREGAPHGAPVGAAGIGDDGKGPSGTLAGGPRWPAPVHRAPGGVGGHRAGHDGEGQLRVASLPGRRDQGGQRRHRDRRLVERRAVLGGQRRHLLNRRGDDRGAAAARRSRPGARPARTPARPPRSPCSHGRRGRAAALRIDARSAGRAKCWLGRPGRSGYA